MGGEPATTASEIDAKSGDESAVLNSPKGFDSRAWGNAPGYGRQ